MAVTHVQNFVEVAAHWAGGAAAAAKDLPAPATAGNLLVVIASIGDGAGTGSVSSIDDAGSTVFARARQQQDATTGNVLEIWWGVAAGASAGQDVVVTKNNSTTSADDLIAIIEFAGTDLTQASLSVNGANTASTTSHDSGSVTPGTTDNVIVAVTRGSSREWTPDADFTNLVDNSRTTFGYKIQSANTAQSYTAVSDTGGFCTLAIAAFKGAAGGGSYSTTMEQGSYSLGGQTVNLNRGFGMQLAQGSYAILGSTALVDLSVVMGQGSYALTGQAVNILAGRKDVLAQGSYVVTGQNVALLYSGAPPVAAYPKWIPLVFGAKLWWLRRYAGLEAAALAEASGSASWAKFKLYQNIEIDVHSVPGYPRPNYTN